MGAPFSFHPSPFALRLTSYVLRLTFYVLRFTLHVLTTLEENHEKAITSCPCAQSLSLPGRTRNFRANFSDGVQEAWVARYNESGSSNEHAQAMGVDAAGNIYVTGYSDSVGRSRDYLTVKYNAAGVKQWTARYNGQGNGDDHAVAVAVDSAGNVYVTGKSTGVVTGYDFATIKYNSAGTQQWVRTVGAGGNGDDHPVALAVDPASGDVYVTGTRGFDYRTIKYNSAGTKIWTATYNGPADGKDYAVALGIDAAGNVYVTGYGATDIFGMAQIMTTTPPSNTMALGAPPRSEWQPTMGRQIIMTLPFPLQWIAKAMPM
jgi:hypothetical protein